MKLFDSCKIYYGDAEAKEIWLGENLVWAPCTYTFNVTVLTISTINEPGFNNASPPCPRVNTWAEGSSLYTFITAATSYTESHSSLLRGEAGLDVFSWAQLQDVSVTFTGTPILTTYTAGINSDQTQTQLRYSVPGTYDITVEVFNKLPQCNQTLSINAAGQAYPTPYTTAVYLGPQTGTVRVVGSANSAPDRFVFAFGDEIVLDTLYRGSSSYQTSIDATHALYGNDPIPIIQCNDCGAGDVDSHGEFDLSFEKNTTQTYVNISAFMPIDESFNSWSLDIFCPENINNTQSVIAFDINDSVGDK